MGGLGPYRHRGGSCSYRDVGTWSVMNRHKHRKGAAMKYFAGLDVSLGETAICVVDETGRIVREVRAASEPQALIAALSELGLDLERIGLEACSLSAWLHEELCAAGLAAACIETRRANAAMKTMRSEEHTSELQSLMRISYAV